MTTKKHAKKSFIKKYSPVIAFGGIAASNLLIGYPWYALAYFVSATIFFIIIEVRS